MRPVITLSLNPYDHFLLSHRMQEPALKQAMAQHPKAKTFTVVPTNTFNTFSFVPNHLTRFIPKSTTQLFTMDYPRETDPLTAHVMKRANVHTRKAFADDIKRLTVDIIQAEKITKHSRK